jgi:hypothetical protein
LPSDICAPDECLGFIYSMREPVECPESVNQKESDGAECNDHDGMLVPPSSHAIGMPKNGRTSGRDVTLTTQCVLFPAPSN